MLVPFYELLHFADCDLPNPGKSCQHSKNSIKKMNIEEFQVCQGSIEIIVFR
jgi:hypothetical protein